MAGHRIPGPQGLQVIEEQIDGGTLPRIAMPMPGPSARHRFDDDFAELARFDHEPAEPDGGGGGGTSDEEADTDPSGKGPRAEPEVIPTQKSTYGVTSLKMPAQFAPSFEKVGSFTIDDRDDIAPAGLLELFHTVKGAMDTTKPLWTRSLSSSESDEGKHELKWDGKISGHSGGADYPGDWLSPHFSPYKLRITLKGGAPEKQEVSFKIVVAEIALELKNADGKLLMMNDPERRFETTATVKLKSAAGNAVLTKVPVRVDFSFADPPADNTTKTDSFKHADPKCLGKKVDPDALHWAAQGSTTTTSPDSCKSTGVVLTQVAEGAEQGKSKIDFKPSGVGGDDFKLKATVKDSGDAELLHKESDTYTVWRFVDFTKVYEMAGQTHVSSHGSTANIAPVFDPAFVRFTAVAPQAITAALSVKYIGLWVDTTTPQSSWATMQAKTAAETPTAAEIANATYAGADPALVATRDTARAGIKAKAQAWATRIDSAFHAAMPKWVTAAGIAADALVAIQYYHPKYSPLGGDEVTNEWKLGGASVPAWLTVDVFPKSGGGHYYTGKNPDQAWVGWAGLSHGNGRVTVPKGNDEATVKQVVRHEAGHATKSFFKRDVFGASLDHSASQAGIMYFTTAGGTTFTDREKKILRGINP